MISCSDDTIQDRSSNLGRLQRKENVLYFFFLLFVTANYGRMPLVTAQLNVTQSRMFDDVGLHFNYYQLFCLAPLFINFQHQPERDVARECKLSLAADDC